MPFIRAERGWRARARNSSVPLFHIRVASAAQFDPKRRAFQLERVPEPRLEIPPVAVRDGVERIAMDDDHRRVHPALVRVTQLGTYEATTRRRLLFDGCLQFARQPRRGKLRKRGAKSRIHRTEQGADALALERGNVMKTRKPEELQLSRNG